MSDENKPGYEPDGMNQKSVEFEPLSEAQRLAYLQAMAVPLWVPRDSVDLEQTDVEPVIAEQADVQVKPVEPVLPSSQPESVRQEPKQVDVVSSESASDSIAENHIDSADRQKNQSFAGYLKVVAWRSNPAAERKMLVICRHHKDQPAQSFARANSPSLFMADYLRSLDTYLADAGIDLQVQLAHLAEAGIAADSLPMTQKLVEFEPEIILLLGEEGVSHLFGADAQLAELRGQIKQVNNIQTVVSYHPYSLIKNPALKKLALEDLKLLVNILCV